MKRHSRQVPVPLSVANLSEEEKVCLSRLLHKDYYSKKSLNIQVESIKKALDKYTVFNDLDFKDILFGYYGENILSKKEVRSLYEEEKMKFFNEIMENYKGLSAYDWIAQAFESKNALYKTLTKRFNEDRNLLSRDLNVVMSTYGVLEEYKLSGKKERFPIFAASITKNPHAFDKKETVYTLLVEAVCHILEKPKPKNAEEEVMVFYEAGIIKDEISNFTTIWGLSGFVDDIEHPAWDAFKKLKEPFNANILNLNSVDKITSPSKKVYIFENPAVFTDICERLKDREVGFICSYGQIKYASLLLMDKLVNSGTTLYYNGDFDPEGLQIAEGLKKRYKDNLVLWRYDEGAYLKSLSEETLTIDRINKLKSLKFEELKAVSEIMKIRRKAGYQELVIDDLVNDMVSNLQ